MPIIEIQKRARELGRIRTGDKGGKGQPQKLSKFRLTSASQPLLQKVADLYGGTVKAWDGAGTPQFEVYTQVDRIPIMVPPQPVSQWLETWTGGGCVHRCDGVTNALTGEPCDPEDRDHINAKPTTRLNVVLREVEGMGVWRLESHGWNAAVELPDAAEFLAMAGGYVEGHLALEERISKTEGQTRRYLVPIIEIDVTPTELMAGRGAVGTPVLEGPVARAIAAAPTTAEQPDYVGLAKDATTTDEINAIWQQAQNAGHMTDDLFAELKRLGSALVAEPPAEGSVVLDPPDVLWQRCLKVAGDLGWKLDEVETALSSDYDVTPAGATSEQLDAFLTRLENEEAA